MSTQRYPFRDLSANFVMVREGTKWSLEAAPVPLRDGTETTRSRIDTFRGRNDLVRFNLLRPQEILDRELIMDPPLEAIVIDNNYIDLTSLDDITNPIY